MNRAQNENEDIRRRMSSFSFQNNASFYMDRREDRKAGAPAYSAAFLCFLKEPDHEFIGQPREPVDHHHRKKSERNEKQGPPHPDRLQIVEARQQDNADHEGDNTDDEDESSVGIERPADLRDDQKGDKAAEH